MWNQGLAGFSALQTFAVLAVFLHLTIVSVTLYLHRYSAHRSLQLNPVLKHLFRLWLWLTTGMITKEWTSIHRKHHAKCETEEDPHSPVVKGLGTVFWRGAELYKQAATSETLEKYGKGTPNDWVERNLYNKNELGISIMLAIDLLLFGAIGISVWAIQMIWIPVTAAGVINGIGHAWGYRNFEPADSSRNILPWALLIGGEELHNNHHTYPNSAKLSIKWWEIDIGWFWISLLRLLGLARVKYRGPIARQIPGKQLIDMNTAWAVLNNRFQIMSEYSSTVVSPLVKLEKAHVDKAGRVLLQRARKLICREPSLVGVKSRRELLKLLSQHPNLDHIYKMRQELTAIWQTGARNAQGMTRALQQWCKEAEQSGIQCLIDFAFYLRSYDIPGQRA